MYPKIKGVNHLALITQDMEKTVRYWRDLLGFELIMTLGSPSYRQYFFKISPKELVVFFEWPGAEKLPEKEHGYPTNTPLGFDHLAFSVESKEDLFVLKDKLEYNQFWVSEILNHGYIYSLYTFDPNNIPLEFSWPLPDIDLSILEQHLDREPVPALKEGKFPNPHFWPTPAKYKQSPVYPGAGSELFHGHKKA